MSTKVFVGNLDFNTTDQVLKDAFSHIGPVKKGVIITRGRRPLGYGFVEFDSPEVAFDSVEKMNKTELLGRLIKVELAKDPNFQSKNINTEGGKETGPAPRRRRRGNTGDMVGEDDIPASNLTPNKASPEENFFGDTPRSTRRRRKNKKVRPATEKVLSKTTLFVANLPFSVDDEKLKYIFEGTNVKSARVVRTRNGRSRGYGFVEFENENDQLNAMKARNDIEVEGANGPRKISVTISNSISPPEDTPNVANSPITYTTPTSTGPLSTTPQRSASPHVPHPTTTPGSIAHPTPAPAPNQGTTAPRSGTPQQHPNTTGSGSPVPNPASNVPRSGTPQVQHPTTAGSGSPAPNQGTTAPRSSTPQQHPTTTGSGSPAPNQGTTAPRSGTPQQHPNTTGSGSPAPNQGTTAPRSGTPQQHPNTTGSGSPAPNPASNVPRSGTPQVQHPTTAGSGSPAPNPAPIPNPNPGTTAPQYPYPNTTVSGSPTPSPSVVPPQARTSPPPGVNQSPARNPNQPPNTSVPGQNNPAQSQVRSASPHNPSPVKK